MTEKGAEPVILEGGLQHTSTKDVDGSSKDYLTIRFLIRVVHNHILLL